MPSLPDWMLVYGWRDLGLHPLEIIILQKVEGKRKMTTSKVDGLVYYDNECPIRKSEGPDCGQRALYM